MPTRWGECVRLYSSLGAERGRKFVVPALAGIWNGRPAQFRLKAVLQTVFRLETLKATADSLACASGLY